MDTITFCCYAKENEIRMKSSSGGIYPVLAQEVLASGGVIYGACYDEALNVEHRKITNEEQLQDSQGSKYVASALRNTFAEVKHCLQEKKMVLFTGTPCQCEGLLNYLGQNYENLYCMDFVCHGLPGRSAWRAYQAALKKRGYDIKSVNMRDKSSGWSRFMYSWKATDQTGDSRIEPWYTNLYMRGFLDNFYLRPSCYECPFKGVDRRTDWTLADYWGVWDLEPDMDDNGGTSLIMIHSEKGYELFERTISNLVCKKVSIKAAIPYNPSITEVAAIPKRKSLFDERMRKGEDFIDVMESLYKPGFLDRIRHKVKKLRNGE